MESDGQMLDVGVHTLCNPKQPPEALVWSSAFPDPEDSVAISTTGIVPAAANSPAAHPSQQA